MKTGWRLIFGAVVWLGLAVNYLTLLQASDVGPGRMAVIFLSFFTVLSNILAGLAFTVPVVAPGSALGRAFQRPDVRGAVVVYIVVVGVIFHLALLPYLSPEPARRAAEIALHYVVPAAFVIDWLIFTPHGALRWRDPVKWLSFPILYGVWTMIHGAASGYWPYPFVDGTALGMGAGVRNMAVLMVVFLILGLGVVALDRVLARFGRGDRRVAAA